MKEESTGSHIRRSGVPRALSRGNSTLEILIAFAVITLTMTAVIMVTFGNQSISVDTQTNNEAIYKTGAMLEKARADSRFDFNVVNPSTATDVSGTLTYTKTLAVTQVDLFTKRVDSTVSWQEAGRTLHVLLSTLLTNPQAVGGGDTCSSVLLGDWTHPQKAEYELGADILHDTSSGFPITSIATYKHKMYVTVHNTNGNNSGTFFVLDITNPSDKPILLGQLDNNPAVGDGLNSVALDDGHYAYVTNAHTTDFSTCNNNSGTNKSCGQMQVIDISNPALPGSPVKYTYKVPGVTSKNGNGIGKSIFYKNGIIYLGLAKATGPEFNIIDVGGGGTPGASPTNPKPLGSYSIGSGINAIYVKGKYAYVASPDSQELKVFDVSDLMNPTPVGGYNAPGGGGPINGHGKSLYLVGNTLYLGRTLISGDELYALNNTNPASNLPMLWSKNIQDSDDGVPPAPNDTSINGLLIRDYLAFLITDSEFQIWRIDNPANIVRYATPLLLPPGSGNLQGTASDCEGNYIFVGSLGSNDKGYISVITGS